MYGKMRITSSTPRCCRIFPSMKITLGRRIILFAFIILSLTILANTGMDIAGFRRDYLTALILRSQSLAESMKGSIEKVLGLGLELRDLQDIHERCRDLVRGNPEIAYCIVTDLDGTILFSNDPPYKTPRFNITFDKGGNRPNLIGDDKQYYDSNASVLSPDGKPVGKVHVGFREQVVTEKVRKMVFRSIVILLLFFLIAFSLVLLFVKRWIIHPISVLLDGVKKISSGSYDAHIENISVPEFNTLAETINFMSGSLKSREEELHKSYKELEAAHEDLHDSYTKLEKLSMDLEKSEELYKSLMEDSSDAIIVIGAPERVMMVNKMAEEFFGYSASEITGLPLAKFLLLLRVENIPEISKSLIDVGKGLQVLLDMPFVNNSGVPVLARINASSMKTSKEQLLQVIFRDVTREQEILNNLEKSTADLARLNRMKDSFLGLASHELKTPLTVIMGYAEFLSTDMKDKLDKSTLEMVQNISNAATRLDSIIKDMVDVSMIDEKKLQLKSENVNINRVLEDSVKELQFFFLMRKQELVMALDESIPVIKGDALRLIQLVSNVLGNAIKFTPDGGKITVSSSVKYLLRSKQHDQDQPIVNIGKERHVYVEVAISDTGIGIDPEDQLRVFDKFYEVGNIEEHSSGKSAFKAKGAGLGLTIAKGIIEMHGGEIWVESLGHDSVRCPGSTFHILLPLDPLMGDRTLDYMHLLR